MNGLQNEIYDVTARAKRRFPDHKVDCAFPVCLPVYELRLKATEIAEDYLSTPARFVLQLSSLNITQPAEIGRLLGISDNYVAGAAAELLAKSLAAQGPDLGIEITGQGKRTLSEGGKTRRPRNRHIKAPYDPLTKRIIDLDISHLLDRDGVRKNGLFVASTNPRKPRLSHIRLDEVRDYENFYGLRRGEKTQILEVSDIKETRLKYRDDVVLVKLDPPNSDKPVFAAYRAQQYLEEESAVIQRLADRGADLVPDELKSETSTLSVRSVSIAREEAVLLEEIDSLDHEVSEAERDVAEARTIQGTTQNAQERADLQARIEKLDAKKHEAESKLNEPESELAILTKGQIRRIKTEEHRPLLLDAIKKASSELTLVSAWIKPEAFDDEICRLLAAAIGRGTIVRIAWGLGTRKRGAEAARNRELGNNAVGVLERMIPGHLNNNLKVKRTDTHEKFIICDDLFCAAGSFNWLSYRGELGRGYRRETSKYSERQDDIAFWKVIAEELFQAY